MIPARFRYFVRPGVGTGWIFPVDSSGRIGSFGPSRQTLLAEFVKTTDTIEKLKRYLNVGAQRVRNVWTRRDLGTFASALSAPVQAPGVVLVKIGVH